MRMALIMTGPFSLATPYKNRSPASPPGLRLRTTPKLGEALVAVSHACMFSGERRRKYLLWAVVRNRCPLWVVFSGKSATRSSEKNSVRREAVEQHVAAGALEVVLAAAAVRSARRMRRVPRLRGVVVAQADAVDVADHRGALPALGPVAAGLVVAGRNRGAVRLRAGQCVIHVRRVAAAVDHVALFGERGLLGEVVVRAVQVGNVLRDRDTLGVLPRALANA